MKRIFIFAVIMAMVLAFSMQANAALSNRGTDSLGNRLIYDSDRNLTWYDFTNSPNTWQNQMNWASGLTVEFNNTIYNDWRLPSTVDGQLTWGFDGTTTGGYNITNGEMGHLYYTELENMGYYDTSGNPTSCNASSPYCLTNSGLFTDLQVDYIYWSGTEYGSNLDNAWDFQFSSGYQYTQSKSSNYYGLAVRAGDVAVAPEPVSSLLFITGGALLAGRIYIKRKRLHNQTVHWNAYQRRLFELRARVYPNRPLA